MTLDLQAIFGEPQAVAVIPEPAAAPAEAPSPGSGPQATADAAAAPATFDLDAAPSGPQAADPEPSGFAPAKWTRQPDASGQWGWQRADLPEVIPFDELPNPATCPRCGSLELWETAAADLGGIGPGRWRCLACDPPTRARGFAARAAELRRRATVGASR